MMDYNDGDDDDDGGGEDNIDLVCAWSRNFQMFCNASNLYISIVNQPRDAVSCNLSCVGLPILLNFP